MHDSMAIPKLPSLTQPSVKLSVIIVSFNTRETLRYCLELVQAELRRIAIRGFSSEILVVDNASTDGSAQMVEQFFPDVGLIRSAVNLGFGGANNLALLASRGELLLLLNSDAFLESPVLIHLLSCMDLDETVGMLGISQVGRDGSPQPSARRFHTLWRDACMMTGLAELFPHNRTWGRIFGGLDRKWEFASYRMNVDWIPGAFMLIRRILLEDVGLFDPALFLYVEEVDLCKRANRNGWTVVYLPEYSVIHIGGESAGSINSALDSPPSHQVVLWRMRSTLLYYRKWHGVQAWGAAALEIALYRLRWLRNCRSRSPQRKTRARHALQLIALMRQAWRDTHGGRISPSQPW